MNTINFFGLRNIELRWQYLVFTTLTLTFLTASWWKMHSHIVEFLSVVFACFNVRFTLSIIVQRCLKSPKVKSEAQILFKLSRFRKWNTHTVQQTLGITKKKIIWVIKEQNLHKFVLRWCSEMNIGQTWSFPLSSTWSKVSSTKKNRR